MYSIFSPFIILLFHSLYLTLYLCLLLQPGLSPLFAVWLFSTLLLGAAGTHVYATCGLSGFTAVFINTIVNLPPFARLRSYWEKDAAVAGLEYTTDISI